MQYDKQYLIDLLNEWQVKANDESWQKKVKSTREILKDLSKCVASFNETENDFFQNFYIEFSSNDPLKILDLSENFPHAEYFFISGFFGKNFASFYNGTFFAGALNEQKDKFIDIKNVRVGDVLSGYEKNVVALYIFIENVAKNFGDYADKSLKDTFKMKLIYLYNAFYNLLTLASKELLNGFFEIILHNQPYILVELIRTSIISSDLDNILSLFSDEYVLNFTSDGTKFNKISINQMCEIISLICGANENIEICHFNQISTAVIGSLFDEKITDFKEFCIKSKEYFSKFCPFPQSEQDSYTNKIYANLFFTFASSFGKETSNKNTIYYGAIATGKTRKIKNILKIKSIPQENVCFIYINKNLKYKDLIDGFYGDKFINGDFKTLCKRAFNDQSNEYFLVLDDLQNGDISDIFGEIAALFSQRYTDEKPRLIRTKNSHIIDTFSDEEKEKFSVVVQDGKSYFAIPQNLHIFGTFDVNYGPSLTASFAKDFAWIKTECDYNELETILTEKGIKNAAVFVKSTRALNDFLHKNYDFFTPLEIGHGTFKNIVSYANDGIISKKSVDLLFENEIVPILLPIFERISEQKDIKITMKVIKDNFIFA